MNEKQQTQKKHAENPSEKKPADDGSLFDKVMPDGIKRGFESLLKEGRLKSVIGEFKLPKEIVNHIMAQVDETKHSALGVISREVRLFLERTNLSDELAKLFTQISFEIKTSVRFVPNERKPADNETKDSQTQPEDPPKA